MEKATLNQYVELGNMIASGNLDRATVQAVIEGRVEVRQPSKGSETPLTLTLQANMSLTDLIAMGKYDWVNDDIREANFPVLVRDTSQELEVILVHLGTRLMAKQVKAELDRRGLKPAEIDALLAIGAAHPDLQRMLPIIALGTTWRDPVGSLHSPCLGGDGHERRLSLGWYGDVGGWHEDWRFLAVRK